MAARRTSGDSSRTKAPRPRTARGLSICPSACVAATRTWASRSCSSGSSRSEEHTSELQSQSNLVCRLLLEKKKKQQHISLALHVRDILACKRALRLRYHITPYLHS